MGWFPPSLWQKLTRIDYWHQKHHYLTFSRAELDGLPGLSGRAPCSAN